MLRVAILSVLRLSVSMSDPRACAYKISEDRGPSPLENGSNQMTHSVVSCLKCSIFEALNDDVPLIAGIAGYEPGRADQGLAYDLSSQFLLCILQAVDKFWDKFCQVKQGCTTTCKPSTCLKLEVLVYAKCSAR